MARRRTGFSLRLVVALGSLPLLAACGGATPPEPARPEAGPDLGPLLTLVPPESTFVVLARPAELMADPATRRVVTAVVPDERLERFAAHTGVDPRELTELVLAVHPGGRVVLARGPFDAPFAVREAGQRMAPVESSIDEPFVRRAGFLGSRRVELAALADDVVVWIEGTPQLAAAVLAASRHQPEAREHPFADEPVAELRAELGEAPFVLFAPHPLGLPLDTGVGMLLARERALAASARPVAEGEGALSLRAELRGEFPPGAHDNFRNLARSIAVSDLGAALGAQDALPTLRIQTGDDRVGLRARVDAGVLAAGLRTLLVAEMRELIEGPEAAAADAPGPEAARRPSGPAPEDAPARVEEPSPGATQPEAPQSDEGSEAPPSGAEPTPRPAPGAESQRGGAGDPPRVETGPNHRWAGTRAHRTTLPGRDEFPRLGRSDGWRADERDAPRLRPSGRIRRRGASNPLRSQR